MPGKNNKKVTLALVYAKLVQHDRQFKKIAGEMNRQFARVDERFAQVAKEIFRLEDSLKAEIGSVLDRVRQMEQVLDKQTADIEALHQEYFALLQAVRRIDATLQTMTQHDEKTDRTLQEVVTRLEGIEARLTAVEHQAL